MLAILTTLVLLELPERQNAPPSITAARPIEDTRRSAFGASAGLALDEEPERQEPDPEAIAAALEALEWAFEDGDLEARLAALYQATDVPHRAVVSRVDNALDADEPMVVAAALEALRFMQCEAALETLIARLKRDKRFRGDPEWTPKLIRAIGQHGDPATIDLLAKDLFRGEGQERVALTGARLLAIGNIRTRKSVETLIGITIKSSHRLVYPHRYDLRLALMILTGVDRGESFEAWQAWWKENQADFEVADKVPLLPRDDQRRWERFWGTPRKVVRPPERGARGGGR